MTKGHKQITKIIFETADNLLHTMEQHTKNNKLCSTTIQICEITDDKKYPKRFEFYEKLHQDYTQSTSQVH